MGHSNFTVIVGSHRDVLSMLWQVNLYFALRDHHSAFVLTTGRSTCSLWSRPHVSCRNYSDLGKTEKLGFYLFHNHSLHFDHLYRALRLLHVNTGCQPWCKYPRDCLRLVYLLRPFPVVRSFPTFYALSNLMALSCARLWRGIDVLSVIPFVTLPSIPFCVPDSNLGADWILHRYMDLAHLCYMGSVNENSYDTGTPPHRTIDTYDCKQES